MAIVTWWVPGAMAALGLLLFGLGLFGWLGGRSRRAGSSLLTGSAAPAAPDVGPPADERAHETERLSPVGAGPARSVDETTKSSLEGKP
jgi:hypothetical protein